MLCPAQLFAQQEEIPPLPVQEQAAQEDPLTEEMPPLPTKEDEEREKAEQARQAELARAARAREQAANTPPAEEYSLGTRLFGRIKHSFYAARWLQTTGYTIGTTMQSGSGQFSSREPGFGGPSAMGYTLQERNGVVSGLVIAVITQLLMATAAASIAAPETTYMGSSTNRNYNADGSVTVTRTDYYSVTEASPENIAAAQAIVDNLNSGAYMAPLAGYKGGQNFEFTYFTDDWLGRGTGQTQGVRANFLLSRPLGEYLIGEAGYGWGRATSSFEGKLVESRFNGVPLRLLAPFGPFMAQAGVDLNASKLFTILDDEPLDRERNATWPISLSMHAFLWRLHASAGIEVARIIKRDVGYNINVGMRF